ncbi:MAG: hypothetical protein EOO06_18610 [Chitinophagaceae bacterium]|nr:MAG: hypothetical protein EOO06_18610 [Chitinophagaceae bacterium]
MNRNHFLKKLASVSTILSLPFTALASLQFTRKNMDKGFKVPAGKNRENKPLNLFEGNTFNNKVSDSDNGVHCMFSNLPVSGKVAPFRSSTTNRMNAGIFCRLNFYSKLEMNFLPQRRETPSSDLMYTMLLPGLGRENPGC